MNLHAPPSCMVSLSAHRSCGAGICLHSSPCLPSPTSQVGVTGRSQQTRSACAGAAGGVPALVYASLDRIWVPADGGLVPGRVRRSLGARALLDGLWQRCAWAANPWQYGHPARLMDLLTFSPWTPQLPCDTACVIHGAQTCSLFIKQVRVRWVSRPTSFL